MLKKLLLVGAIIAIIPLEQENQAELYKAAKSTVADISGFCFRNRDVCDKGNEALDTLATKAEFGARMMVDIAKEQAGSKNDTALTPLLKAAIIPDYTSSTGNPSPARSNERFPSYRTDQPDEIHSKDSNTLSSNDLKPDWRGGSEK